METTELSLADQAFGLLKQKNYDQAKVLFQRAIAEGQALAESMYGLGLVQLSINDPVAAKRLFESCVAQQPEHANARYYLGYIAELQGKREEAIAAYQLALRSNRNHAGAAAKLKALGAAVGAPLLDEDPSGHVELQGYGTPLESPANVGGHDFYGLIHRSNEPVEQEIKRLMDEIEEVMQPRRARLRAYALRFLFIPIMALVIFFVGAGSQEPISVLLMAFAVIVCPIILIGSALSIRSRQISSSRYVIVQQKGVFLRTTTQDHLWLMSRDRPRTVKRSLLNRLTGDGTLIVGYHAYKGFFRGAELEKIQSNLTQLALLMPTSRLVLSAIGELKNIRSGA